MTTIEATPSARRTQAGRILAVTRLLFVNRTQVIYTPLIVLGGIFLLNLVIWWVIIAASGLHGVNHLGYSGSSAYIYVYAIIMAVQSIQRTFPFSLGFGVTRREFSLGTGLGFVILSAFFAAVLTIMSTIEIATNGWGVGGRMFSPLYFTNSFWLARFLMAFLLFLFCLAVGSVASAIYVRWRSLGITIFFGSLAIVIVALFAWVTGTRAFAPIGNWLVAQTAFSITAWTLVPTVIAAIGAFLVLRRATTRS